MTYNILGCEQHGDKRKVNEEVTDIPVKVPKTCEVSLDNPNWHTDVDNETTPIACKTYETQYPCENIHCQQINIYE